MLQDFDIIDDGIMLWLFFGAFILLIGGLLQGKGKIHIPKYDWVPIIMIPMISLVFVAQITINKTIVMNEKLLSMICFVLQSGAFLFLYGEIIRLMEESRRQQQAIEQNRFYEYQVEMMQKSLDEIKEIRHDMKNKLVAFSKHTAIGKTEEAANLISEMIEECCNGIMYAKSGNMVIDSIIEYKLRQAKDLNICFQSDIIVPKELECMVSDLGVVIGNLLDNAIEATIQVEDRWICLKMEYTKGRLLLKMSNSYNGNIKKMGNRIVTSKRDSDNHGMGLKSVERVVQKFDGEMELSYSENVFEVMILMYLTSQKKKQPEGIEMQETGFMNEFDGLPQSLQDWGKTAIKQIISPEKRDEAAKEVRVRIDKLWEQSIIENISSEKKESFVLSELGDADLEAERLAEKYRLKENPVKDRIIGVILLFISGMLSIYVYSFYNKAVDIRVEGHDLILWGLHNASYAATGAIFLILVFIVIGLKLIFQSRKKERK